MQLHSHQKPEICGELQKKKKRERERCLGPVRKILFTWGCKECIVPGRIFALTSKVLAGDNTKQLSYFEWEHTQAGKVPELFVIIWSMVPKDSATLGTTEE